MRRRLFQNLAIALVIGVLSLILGAQSTWTVMHQQSSLGWWVVGFLIPLQTIASRTGFILPGGATVSLGVHFLYWLGIVYVARAASNALYRFALRGVRDSSQYKRVCGV
jgi:hypothetical protein